MHRTLRTFALAAAVIVAAASTAPARPAPAPTPDGPDISFSASLRFPVPSVSVGLHWGRYGAYHRQAYRPPRPRYTRPVVHRHRWSVTQRRIWVPPVWRTVRVGYDCWGAPVYRRSQVRGGYYRAVSSHRCACGASRR